jgi:hypothetical protein
MAATGCWVVVVEDELRIIKQAARYLSIVEPVMRLAIRGDKITTQRITHRHQPIVGRSQSQRHLLPLAWWFSSK